MIDTPPYTLLDPDSIPSPAFLVFRDLVAANLDAMIRLAGGVDRLRPHAKTHKSADVVRMGLERGIQKHKCATIAEAEMLAVAGAGDVVVAYPMVGPNVARFVGLVAAFPLTTFRAMVDAPEHARALSEAASGLDRPIPTLVDLDVGMGRTGIAPDDEAVALYEDLDRLPGLAPDGLSAYDGHVNEPDLATRERGAREVEDVVLAFRDRLLAKGLPVPRLLMGGTPSFPVHAAFVAPGVECSPGTVAYHDYNYHSRYPDLPFTPAALLLTRVVSRPRPSRLCLDLGHKAVAADPAGVRAFLPSIPDAKMVGHSEEHLVLEVPDADRFPIGTPLLAIPAHVCPTTALHRRALVVVDGRVVDEWEVTARDRRLRF
ncbi:D-TA family PLP-dependent enzyme [Paludisphaera mucosa]|uniref:D-TA family PLP-dependent enzyme n=1 Tax=Paludisphaera mucosa TaxID=3030827 RepID=A0ABT6FFX4_9BACT|nr:D-TA family PLP-dependent enzyme [Paludisphaera mucosa]MDG3006386.1 D-TA family PLP-dependent enzyme [Paludisphaera mucosa]